MPTPDTITRGAGQARRSAARLILSVAKYSGLTLAGIILFRAGASYVSANDKMKENAEEKM